MLRLVQCSPIRSPTTFARGMEARLSGLDSENATGAHHIYEREGFITINRHFKYRADVLAREGAE